MQEGCSTSIRMRFPSSCLSLMFPRVMFYTSCHEHDQILTCMLHALQSPGPPSSPIIMATWPGTLQIPSPRSAADDPHGRHVRDPVSVSMCLSDLGLSMFFSTLQSSSNRNFVGLITSLRQYSCHFAQALGSPSKSQEKAVPRVGVLALSAHVRTSTEPRRLSWGEGCYKESCLSLHVTDP